MSRKKTNIVRVNKGYDAVLADVVALIDAGRLAVVRTSNAIMTATYWGVGGDRAARRGRAGRFEIDGWGFSFQPVYDGDDYMGSEVPFDAEALARLRRGKDVRVTVDGREQLRLDLEGKQVGDVLSGLIACARGEDGWWGKGAPKR